MKRKVLIASGCSFTNENFTSDFHPDMDCSWPMWPELLAEKLDMDFINLGHSGAGNEYIYSSILHQVAETNLDDIGLVIPAWTQAQRKDIKVRDVWKHLDVVRNHFYEADINVHGDMKSRIEESILLYYSLQEICKSKNIPLYQFQMLVMGDGFNWDPLIRKVYYDKKAHTKLLQFIYQNPYYNEIDDNFLGWPTYNFLGGFNIITDVLHGHTTGQNSDNMPYDDQLRLKTQISDIDVHPNAAGQIKITEFLYEKINNR